MEETEPDPQESPQGSEDNRPRATEGLKLTLPREFWKIKDLRNLISAATANWVFTHFTHNFLKDYILFIKCNYLPYCNTVAFIFGQILVFTYLYRISKRNTWRGFLTAFLNGMLIYATVITSQNVYSFVSDQVKGSSDENCAGIIPFISAEPWLPSKLLLRKVDERDKKISELNESKELYNIEITRFEILSKEYLDSINTLTKNSSELRKKLDSCIKANTYEPDTSIKYRKTIDLEDLVISTDGSEPKVTIEVKEDSFHGSNYYFYLTLINETDSLWQDFEIIRYDPYNPKSVEISEAITWGRDRKRIRFIVNRDELFQERFEYKVLILLREDFNLELPIEVIKVN